MKRILLLGVSLVALTWVTGCCHTCHNQCVGWDDGCGNDVCGADNCCEQGGRWKLPRRCRHKDRCCRGNSCSVGGCDTGCCDGGMSSGGVMPGYDTSNLQGGGCSACSGGTSSYGGIPIDPSSGWQVVPNSTGSEPTPAPAAGSTGAGLSPMPSSSPIPPPPVSYHTLK